MKYMFKFVTLTLIISASITLVPADVQAAPTALPFSFKQPTQKPPELGKIHWIEDWAKARKAASKSGKPLLVLFQEVPGCSTSSGYGRQVLSHPLVVEAAESLFVPTVVFNNRDGDHRTVLDAFGEPSWNNPVVRILSPEGNPLVPRLADDYSLNAFINHLRSALRAAGSPIPSYLDLVAREVEAQKSGLQQAAFGMSCFWSGEAYFGSLPGVVATRPGHISGREVVAVQYAPDLISFPALVKNARAQQMADRVYYYSQDQKHQAEQLLNPEIVKKGGAIEPDRQPKYYLSQTTLRYLPMTAMQAGRINGAMAAGKDFTLFLSPRQKRLLTIIEQNPQAAWPLAEGGMETAWPQTLEIAAGISTGVASKKDNP